MQDGFYTKARYSPTQANKILKDAAERDAAISQYIASANPSPRVINGLWRGRPVFGMTAKELRLIGVLTVLQEDNEKGRSISYCRFNEPTMTVGVDVNGNMTPGQYLMLSDGVVVDLDRRPPRQAESSKPS